MLTTFALLMIALRGISADSGSVGRWGYHKGMNFSSPGHWKDLKGTSCGSIRQSPVNIVKRDAVFMEELKPVIISPGKSSERVNFTAHATSIYLSFSSMWTVTFKGEGCLRPVAIHWHWGLKDGQGSEHTVDGIQYSMEGHLVTYNCELYSNLNDAIKSPSGLHVFGILYKVGLPNDAIGKLVPHMDLVINNRLTTVKEINPAKFLPQDTSSYFRYEGSLTTPPCTENVIWTVFNDVQTISENQLYKFRSVTFDTPEAGSMGDNFRPVISMAHSTKYIKRVVYKSFQSGSHLSQSLFVIIFLLLLTVTSKIQ